MTRAYLLPLLLLASLALPVWAERRFPPPEFEGGHTQPPLVLQEHRTGIWEYLDVTALAAAMGLSAWLLHKRRSRQGLFLLGGLCLLYFGFFKRGCICPIGSTQNVALALADTNSPISLPTIGVFLLPLLFSLLYGRVFCGAVCPLGAIQDLFLFKPLRVPMWLESVLGMFRYFYLGLAIYFVVAYNRFIICEYDPFVSLFRLDGPLWKFVLGAVFLLVGLFIARPYCRYLCPYGGLLSVFSRWSSAQVRITPENCTNCTLCDATCPFAAIERPREATPHPPGWQISMLAASVMLLVLFGVSGYWMVGRSLAGLLLGLWFGVVIASKLLRLVIPVRRPTYEADKAKCLSCARCYMGCPYERERLGIEGGAS